MNNIIFGDALSELKKLPDNYCDCIITDPPYDININHSAGAFGIKKKLNYKELIPICDGITEDVLTEFIRVLKKINIYIFCSKNQLPQLLNFFLRYNVNWQLLSWHKTNVIPACGNSYMPDTEYILFFRDKGVKVYGTPKTKPTYYVTPKNDKDKKLFGHPTPKPIQIIKNFIINSTLENDLIIDPYCGSGTTCAAAKELNRRFIGIDNNKKYIDIASDRIKNICSQKTFAFM